MWLGGNRLLLPQHPSPSSHPSGQWLWVVGQSEQRFRCPGPMPCLVLWMWELVGMFCCSLLLRECREEPMADVPDGSPQP